MPDPENRIRRALRSWAGARRPSPGLADRVLARAGQRTRRRTAALFGAAVVVVGVAVGVPLSVLAGQPIHVVRVAAQGGTAPSSDQKPAGTTPSGAPQSPATTTGSWGEANGSTPATVAPPPAPSTSSGVPPATTSTTQFSTPPASTQVSLTQTDNGGTYQVARGGNVDLRLSQDSGYTWSIPVSSDPSVLRGQSDQPGASSMIATFLALKDGTAQITAMGDPDCRSTTPACGAASRQFVVTIVVHG